MSLYCPLCHQKTKKLFNKKDYFIFSCVNCYHLFSYSPTPFQNDFYEKSYFQNHGESKGYENYDNEAVFLRKDFKNRLEVLLRIKGIGKLDTLKLLDIGCANGLFLEVAQTYSLRELYGIDVSEFALNEAKQKGFKVSMVNMDKNTEKFEVIHKNFFNIITAFDVIEHCNDPILFFKKINCLLAPGGILYLSTPNSTSLLAKVMGKHWIHFKKEHLHYFSKQRILSLLEASKFSIISVTPIYSTTNFISLLRKLGFKWISEKIQNTYLLNQLLFKVPTGEMEIVCRKGQFGI